MYSARRGPNESPIPIQASKSPMQNEMCCFTINPTIANTETEIIAFEHPYKPQKKMLKIVKAFGSLIKLAMEYPAIVTIKPQIPSTKEAFQPI